MLWQLWYCLRRSLPADCNGCGRQLSAVSSLNKQSFELCPARTEAKAADPGPHPDAPPARSWGLWAQQTLTPGWKARFLASCA